MFLELLKEKRRLTGDEITEQIRTNTSDLAGISVELLPQKWDPRSENQSTSKYRPIKSAARASNREIRDFMEETSKACEMSMTQETCQVSNSA